MFRNNWLPLICMVLTIQVSNSVPPYQDENATSLFTYENARTQLQSGTIQVHKVIKRFTPRFPYPRPQFPPLPRPSLPFSIFHGDIKGDDYDERPPMYRGPPPSRPGPGPPGDRTLLAAKKAIILKKAVVAKKAIILAKLKKKAILKKKKKKKWKKKAAIAGLAAYGLNKVNVKGGFTIKAPKVKVSVKPAKVAAKDKVEEEEEEEEDEDDLENANSNKNPPTKQSSQQGQMQNHQQQMEQNDDQPKSKKPKGQQNDAASKKAKKKGKKAKKKFKPRPVNLGVKAEVYKKFDKFAKQAQDKLSSFVQIDIDFMSGRSALDDLIEPGRFVARTSQISHNSLESDEFEYVSDVQVPGNFIAPWSQPVWEKAYPEKKHVQSSGSEYACFLKPVYLVFLKSKEDNVK